MSLGILTLTMKITQHLYIYHKRWKTYDKLNKLLGTGRGCITQTVNNDTTLSSLLFSLVDGLELCWVFWPLLSCTRFLFTSITFISIARLKFGWNVLANFYNICVIRTITTSTVSITSQKHFKHIFSGRVGLKVWEFLVQS